MPYTSAPRFKPLEIRKIVAALEHSDTVRVDIEYSDDIDDVLHDVRRRGLHPVSGTRMDRKIGAFLPDFYGRVSLIMSQDETETERYIDFFVTDHEKIKTEGRHRSVF